MIHLCKVALDRVKGSSEFYHLLRCAFTRAPLWKTLKCTLGHSLPRINLISEGTYLGRLHHLWSFFTLNSFKSFSLSSSHLLLFVILSNIHPMCCDLAVKCCFSNNFSELSLEPIGLLVEEAPPTITNAVLPLDKNRSATVHKQSHISRTILYVLHQYSLKTRLKSRLILS